MKVKLTIPFPKNSKLILELRKKYQAQTKIFESVDNYIPSILDISHILKVKPANISHYLKCKIGQKINAGEILAIKKSIFSIMKIKSPIEGYLSNIDLSNGLITISQQKKLNLNENIIPFDFTIAQIHKDICEIEVEGHKFAVKQAKGQDTWGKLLFIKDDDLNIFDLSLIEPKTILLAKEIDEEQLVKIKVLGGCGLILLSSSETIDLSYAVIDKELFNKLKLFHDKKIWLRPQMKEIVVEN